MGIKPELRHFIKLASDRLRERSYDLAARIDDGGYGPNVVNIRRKSITFDMFRVRAFDGTCQVTQEAQRLLRQQEKRKADLERRNAY